MTEKFLRALLEETDFDEHGSEEDVEHYGVLGMKWGVRKDPDKAYRKSADKLKKLSSKADSERMKSAKADATSAQKYERKAAKYTAKAAKSGVKDSRAEMKAKKLRMKAGKARTLAKNYKYNRKAEILEYKSAKKEFKAAKYTKKAAKAAKKAADLNAGRAGHGLKALRYDQKAKNWANEMNKAFANTKVSSFDPSDIAAGEAYGVTFINEYMKRAG